MIAQLDFLPGLRPALSETMPPAQPHRPTSVAAAHAVRLKAGGQAHRVLKFMYQRGHFGATHLEAKAGTGLEINEICGRFKMLRDAGYVEDSRTTRTNPTGHDAVVWIITEEGRLEVERLVGAGSRETAE